MVQTEHTQVKLFSISISLFWAKGSLCASVGTKGVHYHIHLLPFLYWQAQVFNMKMIAEKPKHRSIYRTIILRWKSKDYLAKGTHICKRNPHKYTAATLCSDCFRSEEQVLKSGHWEGREWGQRLGSFWMWAPPETLRDGLLPPISETDARAGSTWQEGCAHRMSTRTSTGPSQLKRVTNTLPFKKGDEGIFLRHFWYSISAHGFTFQV